MPRRRRNVDDAETIASEGVETPTTEAEAAPAPARLVYSGPSAVLVFEGVEFPVGVPVEATEEMIARLAAHPIAGEGHLLTLVE
jgi:hypothetical protein